MISKDAPLIVHIDEEDSEFYKTSEIIGTDHYKIGHKEQFLITLSLGFKLGKPKKINRSVDFFRSSYLTEEDESILYAISIAEYGDIKNLESNDGEDSSEKLNSTLDENKIFTLCEEYATAGVQILRDLEKDSSFDNFFYKFEELIKKDVDKIIEVQKDE